MLPAGSALRGRDFPTHEGILSEATESKKRVKDLA